jgi:hypothetical protein
LEKNYWCATSQDSLCCSNCIVISVTFLRWKVPPRITCHRDERSLSFSSIWPREKKKMALTCTFSILLAGLVVQNRLLYCTPKPQRFQARRFQQTGFSFVHIGARTPASRAMPMSAHTWRQRRAKSIMITGSRLQDARDHRTWQAKTRRRDWTTSQTACPSCKVVIFLPLFALSLLS